LVILVDQLRFPQGLFTQDLMDLAAPNLAQLRSESVSFDSHYAAAAMCSPSRSTMLTGLYTHQNGLFLTSAGSGFPQTPDLDPGFPTWGSVLNSPDFRYNTYWWGKWHLSENDSTTPEYARQYGFIDGGLPCPAPNTGLGRGLGVDPVTVDVFKDWLSDYTQSESGAFCTTVSLLNPHDVAWFPGCTYGRPPINDNPATPPQPGEDNPPSIFHDLPANFERWPEALAAQGKPTLQQVFVACRPN
jgi:arylsulfatase A-like enzyme